MLQKTLFCLAVLLTTSYSVFAADWKHATFRGTEGAWISVDYQLKRVDATRVAASPVWINLTLPPGADCNAVADGDFQSFRYVYSSAASQVARPEKAGPEGYVRLERAPTVSGCRFTGRSWDLLVRDSSDALAAGKPQFSTSFRFYLNQRQIRLVENHGPVFQVRFAE